MIVRLYETGNLDLETVGDMLWKADRQANFHPESRWLDSNRYSTEKIELFAVSSEINESSK